ncbi:GGDEF domain-containing protein [Sphingobium sp. AP49]|uniref:GGDEF domain-containing protein n=1 Tax=Sphingobium sp. AP49 TaxID=1144307 RepID=UPI00026ED8DA|nr:GGDEF domain-containing protein [Sphingobium sp. AP49]WHO37285.1 GGDEF domain-containing protein [Sphingobium sp. AP49]
MTIAREVRDAVRRLGIRRGWRRPTSLSEPVYRDLVATLFTMAFPILGLGVILVALGLLLFFQWRDSMVGMMTVLAAVITLGRLAIIAGYKRSDPATMAMRTLQRWERRYAWGTYAFALVLALFNIRVLATHSPLSHLVAVSLVFTFGAGVVSRIAGRPVICITALLLATVPTIAGLALHAFSDARIDLHAQLFLIESVLVATVTGMSLQTVWHLYASSIEHLTTKHELSHLARKDALTGLPNRLHLREHFEEKMRPVMLGRHAMALHFLDLDGFKGINDRFGHPVGDALLRQVADRLNGLVRTEDMVGRLGGDEFVVIQCPVRHPGEAEMLARRIIRQLSATYEVNQAAMDISVSVGIALAPDNGDNWEELSAHADAALYCSKRAGKAQFAFYQVGQPAVQAHVAGSIG